MSVGLVVPYYGPLPKWLPLFFESVGRNPSIRMFFVTAEMSTGTLPANVAWVHMPVADIERRVRERLSPEFRLSWPYKLCDLKPYYGVVFEDLLKDSAFWGYSDLDLVFGRVDVRLTAARLASTDVFTADTGAAVGTFAVYRNDPGINRVATRIPDFQSKLNAPDMWSLDEIALTPILEGTPGLRWDRPRELSESQLTISAEGRMAGRTKGVEGDPSEFYSTDGTTFIQTRDGDPQEVMYLHFAGLKRNYHWTSYDPSRGYSEFSLSASGFRPWRTAPTTWRRYETVIRDTAFRSIGRTRALVAASMSGHRRRQVKGVLSTAERWFRGRT